MGREGREVHPNATAMGREKRERKQENKGGEKETPEERTTPQTPKAMGKRERRENNTRKEKHNQERRNTQEHFPRECPKEKKEKHTNHSHIPQRGGGEKRTPVTHGNMRTTAVKRPSPTLPSPGRYPRTNPSPTRGSIPSPLTIVYRCAHVNVPTLPTMTRKRTPQPIPALLSALTRNPAHTVPHTPHRGEYPTPPRFHENRINKTSLTSQGNTTANSFTTIASLTPISPLPQTSFHYPNPKHSSPTLDNPVPTSPCSHVTM